VYWYWTQTIKNQRCQRFWWESSTGSTTGDEPKGGGVGRLPRDWTVQDSYRLSTSAVWIRH